MKNYYDILDISIDASKDQIKEAYRKLANKYHPDKQGNDDSHNELFKDINEAKQVLINDAKKAEYDLVLSNYILANHNGRPGVKRTLGRRVNAFQNTSPNRNGYMKYVVGSAAVLFAFIVINSFIERSKDADITDNSIAVAQPVKSENISPKIIEKAAIKTETKKAESTIVSFKKIKEDNSNTKPESKVATQDIQLAKETKRQTKKILGNQQFAKILAEINAEKIKLNSGVNCVQVIRSKSSNIENAFDIAPYLRAKGFVISGREITNRKSEGIQIDATDKCIRVVLGEI